MRYLAGVLALFLTISLFCDDADARWRRRRSRNYYRAPVASYSFEGSVQEIAQQKADLLAARGYGFHPGGYIGSYEGWGMGPTREAAMYNTCNGRNCMSARGRAQAWSERAGCWFAINIW